MSPVSLVLAAAFGLVAYTYVGYPILVWLAARRRRPSPRTAPPDDDWPTVSILVAAHNAAATLERTLDAALAFDYPAARRQILVVSDASTDATDAIARAYVSRGAELVRVPIRRGKTAAENLACRHFSGEIVVTLDASIVAPPSSLKALIAAFADPGVGVASGRDISVARTDDADRSGESSYVGYEMWVREQETGAGGIVGASGCFYAERTTLYRRPVPEHLSRDFMSALVAREAGYCAVSVREAVCFVPRSPSLASEYRRKVRTIARGIATLGFARALLNPLRYGGFAVRLWSHKVCRWLVPPALMAGAVGLVASGGATRMVGIAALVVTLAGVLVMAALWRRPELRLPKPLQLLAFATAANLAVLHAWWKVLRGDNLAAWDPTRRAPTAASTTPASNAQPRTAAPHLNLETETKTAKRRERREPQRSQS